MGKKKSITHRKITVIKTLIIPIFNLLFIALPNPDFVISDQINKTLYDFVWNKNAKIKKTIVVKQYAEGGLKNDKFECLY